MLNGSSAVTVMLNELPAVVLAGALTLKCDAAAALMVTVLLVPVIDEVTVSVPVIVRGPTVFSVAENVPTPLASVVFAGRTACPSFDVKCTVPAYPVAVLLN